MTVFRKDQESHFLTTLARPQRSTRNLFSMKEKPNSPKEVFRKNLCDFVRQYSTKKPSAKRPRKMLNKIRRKTAVSLDFPDRRPSVSIAGLKACREQLKSWLKRVMR